MCVPVRNQFFNRFCPQEGKKLDFVVRVQSAKGIPKRFTVSKRVTQSLTFYETLIIFIYLFIYYSGRKAARVKFSVALLACSAGVFYGRALNNKFR